MERIDLKKLEVAIKYVDRISKDCNPVNNLPLEEYEALYLAVIYGKHAQDYIIKKLKK